MTGLPGQPTELSHSVVPIEGSQLTKRRRIGCMSCFRPLGLMFAQPGFRSRTSVLSLENKGLDRTFAAYSSVGGRLMCGGWLHVRICRLGRMSMPKRLF